MPRPIQYNREDVLDKALLAFWRVGYAGCSIQVLVDATAMSRQGIYNTFGDKSAFFREVVEHYKSIVIKQCQQLGVVGANQSSLRAFVKDSLMQQNSVGPGACFFVITAFSQQVDDPEVKSAVEEGANIVRKAFTVVFSSEQSHGRLPQGLSPEAAADYLYCVMNGLSALIQTGGAEIQIDPNLNLAFQALYSNKDT